MSYYSKQKNELSKIGADGFAVLDHGFYSSGGRKSKPSSSSSSSSSAPPTSHYSSSTELYHYQYGYQSYYPNYLARQQQVYVAPVETMRTTETVVDCYEVAKKYGGTVIVDYPKKKPTARRGFFYR